MACSLEPDPKYKFEEHLACPVCLQTLKDPRTLPCCHSFCLECLQGVVQTSRDEAPRPVREFRCPCCNGPFTLDPHKQVVDMPRNHFICNMVEATAQLDRGTGVPCSLNCGKGLSVAYCVNCAKFLCRNCLTGHNSYLGLKDHGVLTMEELSKPEKRAKIKVRMYCNEHEGEALKVYCETCDKLICKDCMDFKHGNQNHACFLVKDVASKYKDLLASNNNEMENVLKEGNACLKRLSLATKELDDNVARVRNEIGQRKEYIAEEVNKTLNQNAEKLLKQVEEKYLGERRKLDAQTNVTKQYVESVQRSIQLSNTLSEQDSEEESISSQKERIDNTKSLLTKREENLKRLTVPKFSYTTSRDPVKEIVNLMANSLGEVKQNAPLEELTGFCASEFGTFSSQAQQYQFPQLYGLTGDQPTEFDQLAHSKHMEETFMVTNLFLRYIMAYHYDVFQKLESVCQEITFEYQSKSEKTLKATARTDVDETTFLRASGDFVDFYQNQNPKMHQEVVPTLPHEAISEASSIFSVVIEASENPDELTIYGEKEKVQAAKDFLKGKAVSTKNGGTSSKSSSNTENLVCEKLSCEINNNVKLVVYQGDLTKENVDAIVIPANNQLQHGGGAAGAIVKAGGKFIQDESNKIMKDRRYHSLPTGDVVVTGSGKLPCKFVIHAVCPIWNLHSPNSAMQLLYNAVSNSLSLACHKDATNISIPAIGSGLYEVPVQVCARVLFDAVGAFTPQNSEKSMPLKEIRFVNIKYETYRTFAEEMERRFAGGLTREKHEAAPFKSSTQSLDRSMQNQLQNQQQNQIAFWQSTPGYRQGSALVPTSGNHQTGNEGGNSHQSGNQEDNSHEGGNQGGQSP